MILISRSLPESKREVSGGGKEGGGKGKGRGREGRGREGRKGREKGRGREERKRERIINIYTFFIRTTFIRLNLSVLKFCTISASNVLKLFLNHLLKK